MLTQQEERQETYIKQHGIAGYAQQSDSYADRCVDAETPHMRNAVKHYDEMLLICITRSVECISLLTLRISNSDEEERVTAKAVMSPTLRIDCSDQKDSIRFLKPEINCC